MEKEETQNKKNQNLKDENSDLSKDKKAAKIAVRILKLRPGKSQNKYG